MSEHTNAEIRLSAMNILAMREQSRSELFRKLCRTYPDAKEQVEVVVEQLASENLQDDSRFAESFIRSRMNRGHGPMRITAELRQKGVSSEAIQQHLLEESDEYWLELARDAKVRKFGEEQAKDYKEKTRQMRFLMNKGFSSQQVRKVIS